MKTDKTGKSVITISHGCAEIAGVKPIKGTWLVLLYSDVRVHSKNAAVCCPDNWLFVDELLVNPRIAT